MTADCPRGSDCWCLRVIPELEDQSEAEPAAAADPPAAEPETLTRDAD